MPSDSEPNFEIRALIAVALSLAVMIGWQLAFAPEPPPASPPTGSGTPGVGTDETGAASAGPAGTEATEPPGAGAVPRGDATPAEDPGVADSGQPAGGTPLKAGPPVGADAEESQVVETARYRLSLTNRGARIESAVLKDYEGAEGEPLELVVDAFAGRGHLPLGLITPDDPAAASIDQALFDMQVEGGRRAGGVVEARGAPVTVTWRWADGEGAAARKTLEIPPDGYLLRLGVDAELPDAGPVYLSVGPGLVEGAEAATRGLYLVRGALYSSLEELEHWADDDLEEPQRMDLALRWGGVESNYFAALLVRDGLPSPIYMDSILPEEGGESSSEEGAPAGDAVGKGAAEDAVPLPASGARFGLAVPREGLELPLYLGPKDYDILAAQGHGLEDAVDFGIFGFLAYPLLVGLKWIYGYVGNYGVAIILLTVLIRILFLPLTHTSMKSMRKMQELQPEMKAIRERYKGVKDLEKRQQMNEEIMGLYKEHGVSPLGGCLPMLLQMPVLFAFYACLSVAIEIRHAPFMLWIQDLSLYDPYYVLPVLMGVSMYAQQKMSPTSADPTQARIFRLMPVMFTFFFLSLPSGLVLYWLVNNLLGVGQQAVITRQMNSPEDESSSGARGGKKGKGRRKKRKK